MPRLLLPHFRLVLCLAVLAGLSVSRLAADVPRVLPKGKLPNDRRLGPLKDLNGYFPFEPPRTVEAWEARSRELKRQALVGLGLWPMPTKTPANAVVHGKVDRGDYTVERVYLESFPGHFVTGNLYRPKKTSEARRAAVLCPHGHWPNGRFFDQSAKVRQMIVDGAERFERGGSSPLQARCMQLARMGVVVFHYDMVGYADSIQLQHRPGPRPDMNTLDNWGYQSPQAELHLQSIMGLQTYNSIRALDWVSQLPDVDPKRIGVTGASGGGTQTFVLGLVDSRPASIVPAVMVSTSMQGGCTCENASYLRRGTGNVELAGVFAPKPMGLLAADDWTRELMTKGFPQLEQLYALLGAKGRVHAKALVQFPHNYNYVSRAAMYGWFNKYLQLGQPEPIVEEDYKPLSIAEMTVWDDAHPKPPSGDHYERGLLRAITADSDKQMRALVPQDAKGLKNYREIVGGAIEAIIGRKMPPAGSIEQEKLDETDEGNYLQFASLLRYAKAGEELPVVFLLPKKWNKRVVIWADEQGKQALFAKDGKPACEVASLLDRGYSVVGVDLIGQGEFTTDGRTWTKARLVKGGSGTAIWSGYGGYTYGYNDSLFAQRVHDLLSVIAYVKHHDKQPEQISLVGFGKAGAWVAAARAQAGDAVDRAAIDAGAFRFARLNAIDEPEFVPGIVKYGDLPALLALSAPHPLWLGGEGSTAPEVTAAAYRAAGKSENLTVHSGADAESRAAALAWLSR